jgi:hypothetical protein
VLLTVHSVARHGDGNHDRISEHHADPAERATGEQVTTSSTTSNPGALANSSAAILAPALAFAPAETAPAVDGMTCNAAEVTVDALVERMNCPPLNAELSQNRFELPSAVLLAAVGVNA